MRNRPLLFILDLGTRPTHLWCMKHLTAALIVLSTALPVPAQEVEPDGEGLMERGFRMFMDGLREEMEPALRDLEGLAQDAAPFLREMQRSLGEVVEDFDAYAAPEVLPNGDIIIRRKTPLEAPEDVPRTGPDAMPNDEGSIDL